MNVLIGQLMLPPNNATSFLGNNVREKTTTNFFDMLLGIASGREETDPTDALTTFLEGVKQFQRSGEHLLENFSDELSLLLLENDSFEITHSPFFATLPEEVQQLLREWEELGSTERWDLFQQWLTESSLPMNDGFFPIKTEYEEIIAAIFLVMEAIEEGTNEIENGATLAQSFIPMSQAFQQHDRMTPASNTFSPLFLAALQSFIQPLTEKPLQMNHVTDIRETVVQRAKQLLSIITSQLSAEKETLSLIESKDQYLKELLRRHFTTQQRVPSSGPHHLGDSGVMSKAEQMTLYLGEGKTEHARAQEFIRQFQQLLARSTFTPLKNGMNELSVKLHPEHLGRLDIKIVQENGRLYARLVTTTQLAKEMIESQLHQLRQAFVQQNIGVERIDVQQSPLSYLQQEGKEERERQQDPSKRWKEKREREDDATVHFEEVLSQLTFNEKV